MARQYTNADPSANLSSVPDKNINEEYWRRKLPPGFRYVLDVVARNIVRDRPEDMNLYAAVLLEEIQLQRKKERSLLPDWPYFNKFLRRLDKSRVPPKPKQPPAVGTRDGPMQKYVCTALKNSAAYTWPALGYDDDLEKETQSRHGLRDVYKTVLEKIERSHRCCKCGRIVAPEPQAATGLFYDRSGAPLDSRKLECADGCRVLTLDIRRDKFGHRELNREYPEGEPYIISCRSMAMLLDY